MVHIIITTNGSFYNILSLSETNRNVNILLLTLLEKKPVRLHRGNVQDFNTNSIHCYRVRMKNIT